MMYELTEFVAFTLFSAGALVLGIVYSLYEIYRIGERRLAIIVLILGFGVYHGSVTPNAPRRSRKLTALYGKKAAVPRVDRVLLTHT